MCSPWGWQDRAPCQNLQLPQSEASGEDRALSDELPQWHLPSVVHLRRAELAAICLEHIASGIDLSLAATEPSAAETGWSPGPTGVSGSATRAAAVTGYTRWGATWREREILVRWNWGRSADLLFVLNPAAIRANILLLDEAEGAGSFLLSRAALLEWIESCAWREPVAELIARSG